MSDIAKFKRREIAPEVRALVTEHVDCGPGQFRVVNAEHPELEDWDAEYVCFSGYAGPHSPWVFAAAPELYEALGQAVEEIEDLRNFANNHGGMIDEVRCDYGRAALSKARGEA